MGQYSLQTGKRWVQRRWKVVLQMAWRCENGSTRDGFLFWNYVVRYFVNSFVQLELFFFLTVLLQFWKYFSFWMIPWICIFYSLYNPLYSCIIYCWLAHKLEIWNQIFKSLLVFIIGRDGYIYMYWAWGMNFDFKRENSGDI